MNLDVSVIIPNLNSEIIDQVCNALLNQTVSLSYEIVCVGMDSFERIPHNPVIKRIDTQTPISPAAARNLGVENSDGKLIVLVDADCIVSKDFIEQHQNAHLKYPHVLIGGSVEFPQEGYLQLSDNVSTFHEYMPDRPEGSRRVLPSLNMSIRREDWMTLGGFDVQYPLPAGEDSDFVERARSIGMEIVFFPPAKVLHCHNRNTLRQVIRHAFNFGKYSYILRTNKFLASLIRAPFLFYLLSPLIALLVTIKITFLEILPFKYSKTIPIIYLSKLAWCFGVATQKLNITKPSAQSGNQSHE